MHGPDHRLRPARRHFLERQKNKGRLFPRTPEADVIVTERGRDPDPIPRVHGPCAIEPGTAAQYASVRLGSWIRILHPLPGVAYDVVKPTAIGRFLFHVMRPGGRSALVPDHPIH